MRKSVKTLFVALLAVAGTYAVSPQVAQAEDMKGSGIGAKKKLGVGLGGGTAISGLTGKYYLSDSSAVQATVGIAWYGFGIGADWIIKEIDLTSFAGSKLDLELGAGAGFNIQSTFGYSWFEIGPRGVIGLSWKLGWFPLEVAAEWTPGFYIALGDAGGYGTGLNLAGTAGYLRYYF